MECCHFGELGELDFSREDTEEEGPEKTAPSIVRQLNARLNSQCNDLLLDRTCGLRKNTVGVGADHPYGAHNEHKDDS
jgi:hypothetical protein